jgi:hypothetical protein
MQQRGLRLSRRAVLKHGAALLGIAVGWRLLRKEVLAQASGRAYGSGAYGSGTYGSSQRMYVPAIIK